jgi:hypothetical protein
MCPLLNPMALRCILLPNCKPNHHGAEVIPRRAPQPIVFNPEPSQPTRIVDCEEIVENCRYIAGIREELFRGNLIWLSANLLASTLSRQGLLHSTLRARL